MTPRETPLLWPRRGFGIFAALAGAGMVSYLAANETLREAKALWGWGNMPWETTERINALNHWGLLLLLCGSVASALAFVAALHRADRLMRAEGYVPRWSFPVTAATLLVPVLNLVRPWLGFSEIERYWRARAAGDDVPARLPAFSGITCTLAGLGSSAAVLGWLLHPFLQAQLTPWSLSSWRLPYQENWVLLWALIWAAAALLATAYLRRIGDNIRTAPRPSGRLAAPQRFG